MEKLLLLILIGCMVRLHAYSDEQFCHPHCLITCLPSCKCCNSNDIKDTETSKRNFQKLDRLEEMLRDKDLEVGIVCHASCRDRCLPSCKFECCRHDKHNKKHSIKKKKEIKQDGFDIDKLLISMEETQKQYKNLKQYIHNSSSHHTGDTGGIDAGLHILPTLKQKKSQGKHKLKKTQQNRKILENISKLQDFIEDPSSIIKRKAENKVSLIMKQLDSPFHKLLSSKAKLKVNFTDDESDAGDNGDDKNSNFQIKIKQHKKLQKLQRIHNNKQKLNHHIPIEDGQKLNHLIPIENDEAPSCEEECKQFCSETCKFECCAKRDLSSASNKTTNIPLSTTLGNESKLLQNKQSLANERMTDKGSLVEAEKLLQKAQTMINQSKNENIDVNKAREVPFDAGSIDMNTKQGNKTAPIDHDALQRTKTQLEDLISALKDTQKEFSSNSVGGNTCDSNCKTECLPACPFKCC